MFLVDWDIITNNNQAFICSTRCPDMGPITKFVPTLTSEVDPETLIVVVDDDTAYPPEMVQRMREGGTS